MVTDLLYPQQLNIDLLDDNISVYPFSSDLCCTQLINGPQLFFGDHGTNVPHSLQLASSPREATFQGDAQDYRSPRTCFGAAC